MPTAARLTLVTALALAALTACAGAAAAQTLRFSPGGRVTMRGPITIETGENTVRCNMTLTGTLTERAVEASPGVQVGEIRETIVAGCEGGTVRVLRPTYPLEFVRLLAPTGVLVGTEEFGVLVETGPFSRCLYSARLGLLISAAEIEWLLEPRLRFVRSLPGSIRCALEATLSGSLSMSPRQEIIVV